MACTPKVTFGAARWSRRVERVLARVPGSAEFMADWRDGVTSGRLALWSVQIDGEPLGGLVWDVEADGALTVLAMACDGSPGAAVASEVARVFEGMAKLTGARRLRFWTRRPGLRRVMEGQGYINRETRPGPMWKLEKDMRHGQQ
ncbi:hypothetical protein MHM88_01630 [Epibacterium sp. MM17-32]|uniref:hypothetical protein n=1 Tax=Epibacterium sp. MM17-32 TaxID=2917734 RepID=UPI001EF43564|nr:hypothetical protein [Epibacterium sp. MM17-32]MCG7626490.1 hypothetical protein [Epibacterium sp. MM17-32]